MLIRCGLKSCPHGSEPCESYDYNFKCPIGEIDSCGFFEIDELELEEEFFCLVVGSRSFNDYNLLEKKLDEILKNYLNKKIIIISGGAKGADKLAEKYAEEKGYQLYVINADFSQGDKGGYKRNEIMHQYISKQKHRGCVAFWDGKSKGTQHSFTLAPKYKNQLRTIKVN